MTITDLPPAEPASPAEAAPPAIRVVPDDPVAVAPHPDVDPSERSYIRKVAIAWLVGIPVLGALVAALVLAVGDVGVGGALAVGLFSGFWIAPLAGVVGIGVWASEQSHRP
jgi:hypothetical protein